MISLRVRCHYGKVSKAAEQGCENILMSGKSAEMKHADAGQGLLGVFTDWACRTSRTWAAVETRVRIMGGRRLSENLSFAVPTLR